MTLLAVLGLSACAGDKSLAPPPRDSALSYWSLRIDHSAIQMSVVPPYDTVQLSAIPFTLDGDPWITSEASDSVLVASPTRWYSTDSATIRVSSTGLVSAIGTTDGRRIYVVATRQINRKTHVDSALVQVDNLALPPTIKSFSVRPQDSLKRATLSAVNFPVVINDQGGQPVYGLPVRFRISNPRIMMLFDPWSPFAFLHSQNTGKVFISASTWAYGVAKSDSFTLEVGSPIMTIFNPQPAWRIEPTGAMTLVLKYSPVNVGPGAIVGFNNKTGRTQYEVDTEGGQLRLGEPVDIIFDDPTDVLEPLEAYLSTGPGNILGIPGDTTIDEYSRMRYRRFPKPGTYKYTVKPMGLRGSIIVHDK